MISFPVKALIGLGTAGVVGLGGYGIYSAANQKTIEQALAAEGLVFLSQDTDWDEKVKALGDKNPSDLVGYKKINTWNEGAREVANRELIKRICRGLFLSYASDSKKMDQAKTWCAKPAPTPEN